MPDSLRIGDTQNQDSTLTPKQPDSELLQEFKIKKSPKKKERIVVEEKKDPVGPGAYSPTLPKNNIAFSWGNEQRSGFENKAVVEYPAPD